jgi:hypothetical protein
VLVPSKKGAIDAMRARIDDRHALISATKREFDPPPRDPDEEREQQQEQYYEYMRDQQAAIDLAGRFGLTEFFSDL